MLYRFLPTFLCFAALVTGCRTTDADSNGGADLKTLAADPSARNIALITSGMNKDADDAAESVAQAGRVRQLLKSIGGAAAFEVREYQEATKDELLQYTEQAARDVGSKGTLIWYVATHGWSDGFEMKSGRVVAAELEQALRAGRATKGKMRRLMMIFDYCGSGGTVNEFELQGGIPAATPSWAEGKELLDLSSLTPDQRTALSVSARTGDETFIDVVDQLAYGIGRTGMDLVDDETSTPVAPFYEEAVLLSPATGTQETIGETLTVAMTNVVKEAKKSRPNITIGQFLESTAKLVSKSKTEDFFGDDDKDFVLKKQQVVFRALPNATVLGSLLLK